MAKQRLGLRQVRALRPGEIVWDPTLPGFGARRQRSEAITYILAYRTKQGRQRWFSIGRHGAPWTPDTARAEAVKLLGVITDGGDPAADRDSDRKAVTVAELCDIYVGDSASGRNLTRGGKAKKTSTQATDRSRIERHIKPLLGAHKVAAVTPADVRDFMHEVATGRTGRKNSGKGSATRTTNLLSAIFTFAVGRRMRPDNPCRGVQRFADGRRDRRLADHEYAALGAALRKAEDIWPPAVAAVRFLALTGWRSGEATALRVRDVDITRGVAVLPDSKTGRSVRVLSRAARDLLRGVAQGNGDALVFPAIRGDRINGSGFRRIWDRIMSAAGLPADVIPHTMRHSFASLAADLGFSELAIAGLLGHAATTVTSRYTHQADAVLLAAADAVAGRTAELMGEQTGAAAVIPMVRKVPAA
jgi:integrase